MCTSAVWRARRHRQLQNGNIGRKTDVCRNSTCTRHAPVQCHTHSTRQTVPNTVTTTTGSDDSEVKFQFDTTTTTATMVDKRPSVPKRRAVAKCKAFTRGFNRTPKFQVYATCTSLMPPRLRDQRLQYDKQQQHQNAGHCGKQGPHALSVQSHSLRRHKGLRIWHIKTPS